MKYIYSTLSNDQAFTIWGGRLDDEKSVPVREQVILIHGKANLAHKQTFITPKGVVTKVEDSVLEELQKIGAFNRFVERGFIKVENREARNADDAAKDMTAKDKSAPLDKESMKKTQGAKKATTNKKG